MEKTRKRINEIIENRGTWTIILLSIVFVAALTSFMYLKPKDCLWNFSNILKVCNGNTIYKDINIIVTPMFFFLGTALFKALGTNYFVYVIYNVITQSQQGLSPAGGHGPGAGGQPGGRYS